MTTYTLHEYEKLIVRDDQIAEVAIRQLHEQFGRYVTVSKPPFENNWQLKAHGYIGHIPLRDGTRLVLQPKVPLANLFEMLTRVWHLDPFTADGLTAVSSIPHFYERLAHMLAQRVLDRQRKGLYRAYLPTVAPLPYVRGRIMPNTTTPTALHCEFETFSADLPHNQLLLWTLHQLIRTGISQHETVIRAWRTLRGHLSLVPFTADFDMEYGRINEDYRPMHTLCRFFLAQISPTHHTGSQEMLPILVDMAVLFERFVARWLHDNSPQHTIHIQETVMLAKQVKYEVDVVVRDAHGRAVAILDTKYKRHKRPSNEDFNQVVNYALAHGCQRAFLVYPTAEIAPFSVSNGGVLVQSVPFDLDRPLDQSGRALLDMLTLKNTH